MPSASKNSTDDFTGPSVYENWQHHLRGSSSFGAFEVPLFTDARIVGHIEEGYGPYQLLNPVGRGENYLNPSPSIVLRTESYISNTLETILSDSIDDKNYHGGWLADEVAALISLLLGIRLKAGGITREFGADSDPRGRPVGYFHAQNPILLSSTSVHSVLPQSRSERNLGNISQMKSLPYLHSTDATELIQASRLYQDALWVAEYDPGLTWLLLVSALETAANHWREGESTSSDYLPESMREIPRILQEAGCEDLVAKVTPILARYTGATKKFTEFVLEFLPEPPEIRPQYKPAQVSWEPKAMGSALRKVYGYRSNALHGSGRIPAPMCFPPFGNNPDNIPEERPHGITSHTAGGSWKSQDIPMLLHVFEYISRGVLLNWWKSLIQVPANGSLLK